MLRKLVERVERVQEGLSGVLTLLALFAALALTGCGKEATQGLAGTYESGSSTLAFDNDSSGHYRLTTPSGEEDGIFYIRAGAITLERPDVGGTEIERCVLTVQGGEISFTSCNPTAQRTDDTFTSSPTWKRVQ